MRPRQVFDRARVTQRRERRSGLRPFVMFWPVEMGWSASCFWDRTAEWPHCLLDWPLGGCAIGGRTPTGKARTQIGQSPLRWVLQSPSIQVQSPLEFPDSPDSTGHLKPGLPIRTLEAMFFYIDKKNWNFASPGSREAFPFPINGILDLKQERTSSRPRQASGACLLQACLLRRQSEGGQWASAPFFGADARSSTCADRRNKPTQPPI